jgi:hypothetical protein
MTSLLACSLAMLTAINPPAVDSPAPTAYQNTVRRGLDFLTRDALAWKKEHNCVSCHHASMVVWAMSDARQHGFVVNEPVLAELTTWVAESGDGTTSVPRPAGAPRALNTKAIWFALALAAVPHPDATVQKGLARMRATIAKDQQPNGSWSAWPDTRPPFFGPSDDSMSSLAALAQVNSAGEARRSLDRAFQWLASTRSDGEAQSIALRLMLWARLGRPSSEWQPLARQIIETQNNDGGWSQARGMASDAWATGQAVYALSVAGLRPGEPALIHARDFLIKTQRADGSWPMTSRPAKPGGSGSTSLIPIVGGGSAWAVLGLVQLQSRSPGDAGHPKP